MTIELQVVTQPEAAPEAPLPQWVALFVFVVSLLEKWGVFGALEQHVHLPRKDGYVAKDILVFGLALFCQGEQTAINPFSRMVRAAGLDRKLAAGAGMYRWPTQASVSRALASVTPENLDSFRRHVLPRVLKVPPALLECASFRDSRGLRWLVFDVDSVVQAYRERALPNDATLPPPVRRVSAKAAPGYSGRKRGEKQTSTSRVHSRGTGLWSGQHSAPGNAALSDVIEAAVGWLRDSCVAMGLEPSRIIIRMDGSGGNGPCFTAIRKAGMNVLARGSSYRLFGDLTLVKHLLDPVWYPVADGLTGPRRHAAEFCMLPMGDVQTRLVTSAFTTPDGKKRGAGHVVGKTQFEVYATTLPPELFAAEDIVSVYYNRGGGENDYALFNKEFRPNRTYSTHDPGQDFMVHIAMMLCNVLTVVGAMLCEGELKQAPVRQRPPRVAVRWDERALEDLLWSCPSPPSPEPKSSPTKNENQVEASQPDLEALSETQVQQIRGQLGGEWHWNAGKLSCPNHGQLRLHHVLQKSDGSVNLVLRAQGRSCWNCPKRTGCTDSTATAYKKEVRLHIAGTLPLLPPDPPSRTDPFGAPLDFAPPAPFSLPIRVNPGDRDIGFPSVVPSRLRQLFKEELFTARVTINLLGTAPPRSPKHPALARSSADRQHRRNTYDHKQAWNALPPGLSCQRTLHVSPALKHVLLAPPG